MTSMVIFNCYVSLPENRDPNDDPLVIYHMDNGPFIGDLW